MATQEEEYNIILNAIDEFIITAKKIETKVNKCDNTNIILLSEFAGGLATYIKHEIQTKNINTYEKDKLNRQFNDAQDYFADIQVMFDLKCSCKTITKKEEDTRRKKRLTEIERTYGKEDIMGLIDIAKVQLSEREALRREK